MPQSQFAKVYLEVVFQACADNSFFFSAVQKDLNQIIVDESVLNGPAQWHMERGIAPPAYLPLNLLVFTWSQQGFPSSRPVLVREICNCDDADPLMLLDTDLGEISDGNGLRL